MSKVSKKEKGGEAAASGAERRQFRRQPIMATFSLFVVVPGKGIHRLPIHDLSSDGIGFDLDTEGESHQDFPIKTSEKLDVRLYLNQSLYLPLTLKVVRLETKEGVRKIGAQFADKASQSYKAYASFLRMLEELLDTARVDPSTI